MNEKCKLSLGGDRKHIDLSLCSLAKWCYANPQNVLCLDFPNCKTGIQQFIVIWRQTGYKIKTDSTHLSSTASAKHYQGNWMASQRPPQQLLTNCIQNNSSVLFFYSEAFKKYKVPYT